MNNKANFTELKLQVKNCLSRLISPGSRVLLAVSGGSDSLGLMHLAVLTGQELELAVGFVDHGLREGVDKEFDIVQKQAEKLGIDVHHAKVPDKEALQASSSGSIQAWAREVRYRALEEMARRLDMEYIATGHTRDDQAETVLLRLLRGTGLDGLGGIPDRRNLNDRIRVIRPLLTVTRQEIRDFLISQGLDWVDDPSNVDNRFLRVRVRGELLPLMEEMQSGASERIAALASEAKAVSSFLEEEPLKDKRIIKNLRLSAGVKIDYRLFTDYPRGIWGRIIRIAIKHVRGDLQKIERSHLIPIEGLIESQKSTGVLPLPGETVVYVDRGSLYAFPGALPPKPTGSGEPHRIGPGLWRIGFMALGVVAQIQADGSEHAINLEVRARCPGDRLLGSKHKFKDVLIQARVPRPYRDFVPVLAQGKEIVSSPALVDNRNSNINIKWTIDKTAPFLDIDFVRQAT